MFHFPTFPPSALCVQAMVTGLYSSWVSPFGNPRITARLPTPRGLSQAPTTFFGSWCQGIHHVSLVACHYKRLFDARVHCAVLKKRAVPAPGHRVAAAAARSVGRWSERYANGLIPQDPTTCQAPVHQDSRGSTPDRKGAEVLTRSCEDECQIVDVPLVSISRRDVRSTYEVSGCRRKPAPNMLLRKEVIQPHLPVRLPCYDLVPIASPTFDGSLPKGLGHRLRVLPTFVT